MTTTTTRGLSRSAVHRPSDRLRAQNPTRKLDFRTEQMTQFSRYHRTVKADSKKSQYTTDRRFPKSVYGGGTEPDVRFSLANERTFLAWIRTSLALIASGVALEAFDIPIDSRLSLAASLVLITLGAVAPVQAWVGWMRTEGALRRAQPLPPPILSLPVGLGVTIAGLLIAIGLAVS